MAANTLSILRPSVNNLSTRIFVRAAGLEFLDSIDYELPEWAAAHKAAVEQALGEAYSEPAADVRGFVASAKAAA